MDKSVLISELQHLLQRNNDATEGFKSAAENVKSNDIQSFFNSYAQQRADFSHELKNEITRLGGDPNDTTTVLGSLHKTWLNIKGSMFGDNVENTLEECIRGDEYALEDYNAVWTKYKLSENIAGLLAKHIEKIRAAVGQIKKFKALHVADNMA